MSVVLVNPNLVVQRNDPFTTGIVYMPIGLAYVAASLRASGIPISVIDAFGAAPLRARHDGKFMLLGLSAEEVVRRIAPDARLVMVYANQLLNHISLVELLGALRTSRPELIISILENTQAVTAYSLGAVAKELFSAGAQCLVTGEPEERSVVLAGACLQGTGLAALREHDGFITADFARPPTSFITALDSLSFPAWDLFPLENYWRLRFAHGPQTQHRYLPLLTSRGCPYPCRFCVVPATNAKTWRARSATSVVNEIQQMRELHAVQDFHIEDLNPTIDDRRIRRICQEILDRRLDVTWKISSGTKVESIRDEESLELMSRAGCRYISISPETGSQRLLKEIGKPLDRAHTVRLVRKMHGLGIRSQACFVLGFPGETAADQELTRELLDDLVREGLDEVALFIISPVPGAEIYPLFAGYKNLSELNFTPTWRSDYAELNRFRLQMYRRFLLLKLRHYPRKMLRQVLNFLTRRFETKMEMVPYKALVLKALDLRQRVVDLIKRMSGRPPIRAATAAERAQPRRPSP